MQETQVPSLSQKDPQEKEMQPTAVSLAEKFPRTEEPDRQFMRLQSQTQLSD